MLRIRFDASGTMVFGEVRQCDCDPSLRTPLVEQLRALVEHRARVDTLTPDEGAAVAEQNINVRIPCMRLAP